MQKQPPLKLFETVSLSEHLPELLPAFIYSF